MEPAVHVILIECGIIGTMISKIYKGANYSRAFSNTLHIISLDGTPS